MSNPANIIAYWRASLANADRVSIDMKRVLQSPQVRLAELAAGRIRPEIAAELATEGSSGAKARPSQTQMISVLLCPIVAHADPGTDQARSPARGPLLPLWVPAQLAPNGELLPPEDLLPWVARELLEPAAHPLIIIGSVDELDHFLAAEERPAQADDWQVDLLLPHVPAGDGATG